MPEEPYQSLYRRFRPQRFAEVRGQDHVTTALRNAVRTERVGHAYLFSGPRGTGKTSTARILAKALNCTNLADGEPCGVCESCVAVQAGTSFDVVELDAASNNGVDAMRDLVARAALGSPGRRKVYIVDEVHMLSTAASNTLLKTLEEPPAHVVFVLATTDPQKVLPTIRSRTQSFEFRLLAPELLSSLVTELNERAGLGLAPSDLDSVVRRGNGSARDTLSALDQAAAAGEAEDGGSAVPAVVEAIIAHDVGGALVAVAEAAQRGRDPQRLAEEIIGYLRSAFLVVMAPAVSGVLDHERAGLEDQAKRLGNAALVRAMEVLGETLVEMKEALDTRVMLEMALVRLALPAADTSVAALLERIEMLERRVGNMTAGAPGGAGGGRPASTATAPPAGRGTPPPPPGAPSGVASPPPPPGAPPGVASPLPSRATPPAGDQGAGRLTIGALRQRPGGAAPAGQDGPPGPAPADASPAAPTAPDAAAPPAPAPAAPGRVAVDTAPVRIDRDELTRVWGDQIFPSLLPGPKSVYRTGRWLSVADGVATFALPSVQYRDRAEEKRIEVESALAAHLGGRLAVRLEIDAGGPPPATPTATAAPPPVTEDEPSPAEFAAMEVAPDAPASAEARLLEAFPGTEEVTG